MHTQAMMQAQAMEDAREKEHAIRLANLAGIPDPEGKVEPDLTATVRYGDPNLAALYEKKARNDLVAEVLEVLEGESITGPFEGLSPETAKVLSESGYSSLEEAQEADDEELLAVDGIGPKRLEEIRTA